MNVNIHKSDLTESKKKVIEEFIKINDEIIKKNKQCGYNKENLNKNESLAKKTAYI